MKIWQNNKVQISNNLFLFIIIISILGIIKNPQLSISSGTAALSTWFNIVIPSLLPFFFLSQILISIGFVDFIGKLLQPLMAPLFNLPGQAAFPITMSLISGYPVGPKLTSSLRQKGLINKIEGDRLISFGSTSGPIFMIGAVTIGMLQNPSLGPLIIYPHYLSAFTLGFLFRFYKAHPRENNPYSNHSLLKEIETTYLNFSKEQKSVGKIISSSVKDSMDTIILIGGFIIFYTVLLEILFINSGFNYILIKASNFLSLDLELIKSLLSGILEMTIGCRKIAASNISLLSKILILNFLIGWGGLSIHSQAISFISLTDINIGLYILGKFLHGILSAIFSYLLYITKFHSLITTTITPITPVDSFALYNWLSIFLNSTRLFLESSFHILLLSILIYSTKNIRGPN